ncbi:MAG: cytochrome c3 family protein [Kiritimatiellae bacterium]|nr:cytochrome c3 family protein [Kiritimatiellia bacterium]MDD5521011.1 cytochrome c3 family protein [Kiritimatiellia bacterium]
MCNDRAVLMRIAVWLIIGFILGGALQGAPPPLKVDKSAPLLLDEPVQAKSGSKKTAKQPLTPKSMCYDCHGTYQDDPFSVTHVNKGILCVECHGESEAHKSDEGNITPPEVMYPRDAIMAKCRECHTIRNVVVFTNIVRRHDGSLRRIKTNDVVCTDCHGRHLMNVRTVHWDKKTGKLVDSEGSENNMGMGQLPSGKFNTNAMVLQTAMMVSNKLGRIGNTCFKRKE